jgi:hypothetical protein
MSDKIERTDINNQLQIPIQLQFEPIGNAEL